MSHTDLEIEPVLAEHSIIAKPIEKIEEAKNSLCYINEILNSSAKIDIREERDSKTI